MVEKNFSVIDEAGIHARPASVLVSTANKFESDVFLIHKGKEVNLKSILGVMSLGIGANEDFTIRASGADAQDAIDELATTLQNEGLAK